MTHAQKVITLMNLHFAIARSIAEAGPAGVPSGHLYAMLMSSLPGLSLEAYQSLISTLKSMALIHESGFLLTWTGKTIPADLEIPAEPSAGSPAKQITTTDSFPA